MCTFTHAYINIPPTIIHVTRTHLNSIALPKISCNQPRTARDLTGVSRNIPKKLNMDGQENDPKKPKEELQIYAESELTIQNSSIPVITSPNKGIPEANRQLKTVLHCVTTGTPEYSASQREIFELLVNKPSIKDHIGAERLQNLLNKTKIDKRYFSLNPMELFNKALSYSEKKKIIHEVGGNLAVSVAR